MASETAKKVDVKKAVRYVRQNGGEVDTVRLQHFLGEANFLAAQMILSKYQFPNGGWHYEDDSTKTLSVGASTLWLRVLLELELANTAMVKRTAAFLVEHQEPDGSWYELREKLEKSPQAWLDADTTDNRLWFTISATVFLMASGFAHHPAIERSSDYLSKWWNKHGKFRVTWYPYWAGMAFFANTRGISSKAFSTCHSYTMKRLSRYNGFHLSWVLDMCRLGNLPVSDPHRKGLFGPTHSLAEIRRSMEQQIRRRLLHSLCFESTATLWTNRLEGLHQQKAWNSELS